MRKKIAPDPGVRALAGVSLGVLWTGLAGMFYLRYRERMKIVKSDYYKTSMALLRAFPPAKDKLGHPIMESPIDIFSHLGRSNKWPFFYIGNPGVSITPFTAIITVPLRGSDKNGILYSWSSRDETHEGWRIERLDLEVEREPERFSVYRDNSKFPRAQMLDPRLMNKPKTEADDRLAYVGMDGAIKKQPVADDC